jgi:hypothetical protein
MIRIEKSMLKLNYKHLSIYSLLLVFAFILASCKGLQKDTVVYFNNFESDNLANIIRGKIGAYNGSRVIGRYSQDGFILQLDSLPIHNMLQITFDLYIHDTWDGNSAKPEGPDIWIMNIDGWSAIYATFANGQFTNYTQSYPVLQPEYNPATGFKFFNNKPNSNAIKTDLPGACKLQKINGGTSLYRITRTIEHTTSTLEVGCFAQLEDPDMDNKNCNESWSIDNIKIKTIEFK